MEELKTYLLNNKIFSKKELETLECSQNNLCNICNNKCGELVKLTECDNNNIMCLNCLDLLYDNYNLNNKNNDELFKCICCEKKIYNYSIINK